ncbi:MAG TPA: lysoplasmalogenase [Candidatus Binatia bacterium]|nr:lysoplasmalogenase [Candidatus Binatia bacterium]
MKRERSERRREWAREAIPSCDKFRYASRVMMAALIVATALFVVVLLLAEARGSRAGVWLAKPLASTGFVAVAVAAGAGQTTYGRLVLVALALGWLGDVLLIPRSEAVFRAGIASFLLGHLAFAAAFAVRGLAAAWTALAAAALGVPAVATWRALRDRVPSGLRPAVVAYVAVIAVMVACAVGAAVRSRAILVLVGAVMFFVSDLSVARDRFVAPGFANKLWGLPLYYGGQVALALSAMPSLVDS